MIDYSFHPKLPTIKRGGPEDIYTLENYRYFLYGSTRDFSHWNMTHLHAFWITIFVSMIITIVNFAICYPLAYFMAQVAPPRDGAPADAAAGHSLLDQRDPARLRVPRAARHRRRRQRYPDRRSASSMTRSTFSAPTSRSTPGLTYAYILIMMFPLYNAIESLDHNQIEAARDLGAPWWHIHLFVVMPYAKPGIASGATLVFMLCAGALAAPQILGGPKTLWFTPIVYDRFFQAFNWPQGAAYALILLAACMAFVLLVMRVFKVSLSEIAR